MGDLEQIVLDRGAGLRAAEDGLQRLGARIAGAGVGLAGPGRRQREIGRHHQRSAPRHRKFVRARAREGASAGAGRKRCGGREGENERSDTHDRELPYLAVLPSRIRSARTSKSNTPMVIAASPRLKTKKRMPVAEMEIGIIDDVAEPGAVEDVAERSAEDQREREGFAGLALGATSRR